MDSLRQSRAAREAEHRIDHFPQLSADLRQRLGGYASLNVDYHVGAEATTAEELFNLHAKALALRERCESLTPMMGVAIPGQYGSGQFVIFTYRLTRNMRRLDEKRHRIATGQELGRSKYEQHSSKRFDHHRTRPWSEVPRRAVYKVIQNHAEWRLRFEQHKLDIQQDTSVGEPKPRYHGEEGRNLIKERGDRAIELTKLISETLDDEGLDIRALQGRCARLMDVDCDLVQRMRKEIVQGQIPIRAAPQFGVEYAEIQLLGSIIAKARVIEALCDVDGFCLFTAELEARKLRESITSSPALRNHRDKVASAASEGAARFRASMDLFFEVQGPDVWRSEWQKLQIHAAMAGTSTGPEQPSRMDLYNYGTELSSCILVEFLLEDLGLVEAVKETRTYENMLREKNGIPIDGIAFNNARDLYERIPEDIRGENDIFALGDAGSSLVLENSSPGVSDSEMDREIYSNES